MSELIITEQVGAVAVLTLNRPDKRNALSRDLLRDLASTIAAAEHDPDTSVIVLRGAGPAFCAGYDLEGIGDDDRVNAAPLTSPVEDFQHLRDQSGIIDCVWNCRIPVIAEVHGFCVAGGTDLALNCDLVVAAEDARIGYPPLRYFGVPPMQMWLYHLGPQWTKRMMFTGDQMSGAAAARTGLVLEAVPADELHDHVMALAERVGFVGRELLTGAKSVVNQGVELMGRSQLNAFAAAHDALGHRSRSAEDFYVEVAERGFVGTLRHKNERFGDSVIR